MAFADDVLTYLGPQHYWRMKRASGVIVDEVNPGTPALSITPGAGVAEVDSLVPGDTADKAQDFSGTTATSYGTVDDLDLSDAAGYPLTILMILSWDAYSNNDAMALEYGGAWWQGTDGRFAISPNNSDHSAFAIAMKPNATSWNYSVTIPRSAFSAATPHLLMVTLTPDPAAGAGNIIKVWVDGAPVTATVRDSGTGVAATFMNGGDLKVMCRDVSSLNGAGVMDELAIAHIEGTDGLASTLYASWQAGGGSDTPPDNTVAPAVTGTPTVGETLSCSTGTWTGTPTPTYTRQWQRDTGGGFTNIVGATSSTYLLDDADEGADVRCVVTGTNSEGSEAANSNEVGPIAPEETPAAPANTSPPTISGTPQVGNSLAFAAGTWTGSPTPTLSRQWQRDNAGGGSYSNISGATGTSYALVEDDVGCNIRVVETATNGSGSDTENSNTLGPVTGEPITGASLSVQYGDQWIEITSGDGSSSASGGFRPETYGALRDTRVITDAAISSGSGTLTSASAGFTAEDVGKTICIRGAGSGSGNTGNALYYVGTITARTSSTQVTVSPNASATVSGATAKYGTDDTDAIRAAVDAAVAAGLADGSYYGKVSLTPGDYMVSGSPVLGGDTLGNAQIPLPVLPTTGRQFNLVIESPADGTGFYHWNQVVPPGGAAVLHSTLQGQTSNGTYGLPSVIGGPTALPTDTGPTPGYTNMLLHLSGVKIVLPRNPTYGGVDAKQVGQMNVGIGGLTVVADAAPASSNLFPSSDQGFGLRMPNYGNNDNTNLWRYSCEGIYYAVIVGDHFVAVSFAAIYCFVAIYVPAPRGGPEHGLAVTYASVESCRIGIQAANGGAGGKYPISIARFDCEVTGSGAATVDDPNDQLFGTMHYSHNTNEAPILVGADNLHVYDDNNSVHYGPAWTEG